MKTQPRPSLASALGAATATTTTLASIAFTTWAVADTALHQADGAAPVPIAITVGLAMEMVWLYVLTQEWAQASEEGEIPRGLSLTGWVLAGIAAAVIVGHGLLTWAPMAALGVLPLAAKAAWHWRTKLRARAVARRLAQEAEQERRARELSTDPTEEEELSLAEQARRLEVARRQAELDRQRAEQEHQAKLDQIEREGRERLAEARVHFTVAREVQQHDREIGYQQPSTVLALGSGSYAPDDASALGTPDSGGTGFGAALAQARQGATVRTGAPQQVPTPAQPVARGGAQVSAKEAAARRDLVWDTRDRIIEETGEEPSINALAKATKLSRRSIGRYLAAED